MLAPAWLPQRFNLRRKEKIHQKARRPVGQKKTQTQTQKEAQDTKNDTKDFKKASQKAQPKGRQQEIEFRGSSPAAASPAGNFLIYYVYIYLYLIL